MKRILFSFNNTEEDDIPNGYCVVITTEETWKKKQCLDEKSHNSWWINKDNI